jgi:hypothetical protein
MWPLGRTIKTENTFPGLTLRFPVLGDLFQLIKGEEACTPKPEVRLPEHFCIQPVTPVEKYIKVREAMFKLQFPKKEISPVGNYGLLRRPR